MIAMLTYGGSIYRIWSPIYIFLLLLNRTDLDFVNISIISLPEAAEYLAPSVLSLFLSPFPSLPLVVSRRLVFLSMFTFVFRSTVHFPSLVLHLSIYLPFLGRLSLLFLYSVLSFPRRFSLSFLLLTATFPFLRKRRQWSQNERDRKRASLWHWARVSAGNIPARGIPSCSYSPAFTKPAALSPKSRASVLPRRSRDKISRRPDVRSPCVSVLASLLGDSRSARRIASPDSISASNPSRRCPADVNSARAESYNRDSASRNTTGCFPPKLPW